MSTASSGTVQVDVYFDLICPWCWIGKAHLRTACARLVDYLPEVQIRLRWHSVQLIPDVPTQHGWPYKLFYERRLGGPEAMRARQAQVQAAAQQARLTIAYDRMSVFPNTWQAHCLLALAEKQLTPHQHEALLDMLFEAYFQQGCNLGDAMALNTLARSHGLDLSQAESLETPLLWRLPPGASGVPLFIFNQQHALSGAQTPEVLLSAMRECL